MYDTFYCSVAIIENLAMPRLRRPEFGKDFSERSRLIFTDTWFLISKNNRSLPLFMRRYLGTSQPTCRDKKILATIFVVKT